MDVPICQYCQAFSKTGLCFLGKHGVFSSSLTCDSLPSYVLHNNVNITLFRLNSCAVFNNHSKEMYEMSYQLCYFKMY